MVIPKSTSESRIKENLKATEITLTSEEVEQLKGIDKNTRPFRGEFFLPKGVTVEQAWDVDTDKKFVVN